MEQKNIFQIIAEGIGNTNQNVVELYKLVNENTRLVQEIHNILFPKGTEAPNEGGSQK